jgi:hypothetical protein
MNKKIILFLLFFSAYFCNADSLRLKNGELLYGRLVSYSSKVIQFAMENDLMFKILLEDIDFLALTTSDAVIQLIKKKSTISSFELIGITSEAFYLKGNEGLFLWEIEPDSNIIFSLQNKKKDVKFYESEINNLSIQELWNRILVFSNSKNIIDWIDFSQFNLEDGDVLFYENIWNVLKEYIPEKHHNFLWQLMESYTGMEKNIDILMKEKDCFLTQEKLRKDFLYRIYRLLGKINND